MHDITSRGNRPPNLTVVLVGEDPASKTYVRNKSQSAIKVGMTGNVINLPASITQVGRNICMYYVCTDVYRDSHNRKIEHAFDHDIWSVPIDKINV